MLGNLRPHATTFTQYADNTTAHQNERSSVEETVRVCEPVFSDDNLKLKGEVKAKIKIPPVVVFGVLSRMVLVRES